MHFDMQSIRRLMHKSCSLNLELSLIRFVCSTFRSAHVNLAPRLAFAAGLADIVAVYMITKKTIRSVFIVNSIDLVIRNLKVL